MNKDILRFISPVVRYGLSSPPIRPQKKATPAQQDQTLEHTEGDNAMTVFNYGFANPMNSRIEIEEDTVKCKYPKITGITFRGYPMLRIDDLILEDCAFEDCHTVYFSDCKVNNCQFYGVETVYADRTPIEGCDFEHLRCDNDCVLCLEDSEISFCTFNDVELTNEAYLVDGVGDVWIES